MRTALLRRTVAATGAAVAATATALALTPTPASAHVTVTSTSAVQGGYAKVTFRVPNEKDTAATTQLEINLPTDQPVASVTTKPLTGWTVALESTKLATPVSTDDGQLTEAVSKITWTASPDAAIQARQFQEFDISLGPLPKTEKMVFKALQTYSDGEIVRWIDEPAAGAEAEHPAPVLALAAAGDTQAAHGDTDAAETDGDATAAEDAEAPSSNDGLTRTLAIGGLAVAVAGLVIALLAYRASAGRQTRS